MRSYEQSESTTFVGKAVVRGWAGVLDRYRNSYPQRGAMGTLKFSELNVRLIDPQTAIVTGRFRLTRTAKNGGNSTGLFTLICRKTADGWKIIHDHTSS